VTGALSAIKHTQEEHSRQLALLPTELSQLRADVIGQVQAVEQTLSQEQRFREQVTGKVEELAEEIRQSRTPPDFSPIVDVLGSRMREIEQTLTEIIKQSPTPPDLPSIRATLQSSSEHLQHDLLSALQQPDALPGLLQIAEALAEVQHQVSHRLPQMTGTAIDAQQRIEERLTSLMKQFADRPPVPPNNGQVRAIQASIRNAKTKAQGALDTLYQECMAWLDELDHHMQTLQQGHKESDKSIQTIQAFIAPAEEKASPDGEESQNGMAANEAQEQE
jgi:chromosome segregation ATPase